MREIGLKLIFTHRKNASRTLNEYHTFSGVSAVDFEPVNYSWGTFIFSFFKIIEPIRS